MNKKLKRVLIALLTIGIVGWVALPTSASAFQPTNATRTVEYAPLPLPENSVGEKQLASNSVGWVDWGSALRGEWNTFKARLTAAENKAEDALARPDRGTATQDLPFASKTITNIGGKFFGPTTDPDDDRYTHIGVVTLPSGKWRVELVTKFTRNADAAVDDPAVRPQVGLRVGMDSATSNFGLDFGTVGGNDIAPYKGADLWGSSGGIVVNAGVNTLISVDAFGYNDKRGSEGSGQIDVQATVHVSAA